jgi:prolyl-tRNA synthetase
MLYSRLLGKTLRDKPRNADSPSHQLLLRAGFVRTTEAGGLLLLPLGQRVLARIRAILSAEWKSRGSAEVEFSAGRQATNSDLDRSLRYQRSEAGIAYPFSDHHEAALAMLSGNLGVSYRDLPLLVTGKRWVYREEARPNWGLLAAPAFLLHAAYAFGPTDADVANHLDQIGDTYCRVLDRVGITAFALASGDHPPTTEWAVDTDLAARPLLVCDTCGYRSPGEAAVSRTPEWPQDSEAGVTEAVYGPGLIQVEPLSKFLGIPVHQTTKTMLFEAGGRVVAACVAGIYGVSETKLKRVLGCRSMSLAAPETVRELTNSEVGYAGPVGLPESVEVIWDLSTEHRTNFEAGANLTDHHRINLNFGRDVARPAKFFDIRASQPGESCAHCVQATLTARGSIALGHTSHLGTAYSELLGAKFLDAEKTTRPLPVGCAGLDLTCVLAAIVEQNRDDRGIVWPASVAPFAAHLVSLPPAETAAGAIYRSLSEAGVAVLWDDRPESAGVKFGDADLIGIPVRLVLSKRTGEKVEWKARSAELGELITTDEVLERLRLAPR